MARAYRLLIPYIEPGSPWENGYCESFNRKLQDEVLDPEIFYTLREAQIIIERWCKEYIIPSGHTALWDIGYPLRKPFTKRTLSRIGRR